MGILDFILYSLPGIIIGLSLHEFGHAFMAYKLGDKTPERDGRLTLSPMAHIDPIGLIFIFVAGFGWAKPVRVNPMVFKNQRRDNFLVAFSGPFMNLVTMLIFLILYRLTLTVIGESLSPNQFLMIRNVFLASTSINGILLFFNLLPISPLDGFTVLSGILPFKHHHKISFLHTHGFIVLIILLIASRLRLPLIGQLFTLLVRLPGQVLTELLQRLVFIGF